MISVSGPVTTILNRPVGEEKHHVGKRDQADGLAELFQVHVFEAFRARIYQVDHYKCDYYAHQHNVDVDVVQKLAPELQCDCKQCKA